MHDEQTFPVQAFASMACELNRHTWPVDGEDATTSVGDGPAVLSRCPSYAATSITPALDEETGEVHDGVWEYITRGDGDTTRGDGEASELTQIIKRSICYRAKYRVREKKTTLFPWVGGSSP